MPKSARSNQLSVLCLPGDGIGPEVTDAAVAVLETAARLAGVTLDLESDEAGGVCFDAHGVFLRDGTLARAREVDAVLFGAEGGPTEASGSRRALYEPVHGSAPDIAGQDTANPNAAILSVAMLFDRTAGRPDIARMIEDAVAEAISETGGTPDLGGSAGTGQFARAVLDALEGA